MLLLYCYYFRDCYSRTSLYRTRTLVPDGAIIKGRKRCWIYSTRVYQSFGYDEQTASPSQSRPQPSFTSNMSEVIGSQLQDRLVKWDICQQHQAVDPMNDTDSVTSCHCYLMSSCSVNQATVTMNINELNWLGQSTMYSIIPRSLLYADGCCRPTHELLNLSITAFIAAVARHYTVTVILI